VCRSPRNVLQFVLQFVLQTYCKYGVTPRHWAILGGKSNPAPTIQNALFRSSSTVEQAAVNRKVQGSNPCSGAKTEYATVPLAGALGGGVRQPYSYAARNQL
jgi:hypothetical protein